MKKYFLLLFLIVSCSTDEQNCRCTAKYRLFSQSGFFYVENTEIDCVTKQPIKLIQPDAIFCGCVD
jgi:hypothetical protein